MMSKYPSTLIFLCSLWVLVSCGASDQPSQRTTSYGTSPDGDRSNPSTTDTPTAASNTTGATGSEKLASYLYSLADAEKISPLVLPYQAAGSSDLPTQDPSLNSTRDFIAKTLDDMMNLPAHAPGRDFTVTVSGDTSPNASALNQSVVINKGIIDFASNLSLALVICHEVAHSTRNHSAQSEKFMVDYETKNKASADKLDKALSDLVATNFDKAASKFTHKNSDYIRIKPTWDAFWKNFVDYQKRFESEADVVGGRICANAGFSAQEVESGFKALFQLFKNLPKGSGIKEGVYTVTEAEIGEFLHSVYGDDTHPTDQEREDQIDRVKSVFKQGSSTAIAESWKSSFPGKASLALAPTPSATLTKETSAPYISPGARIIIRRTQSSINH